MEVVLLRHGRPAVSNLALIAPRDLHAWLVRYDQAGVSAPPAALRDELAAIAYWVSSSSVRSNESARMLGREADFTGPDFAEAGLPEFRFGWRVFPAEPFARLARALWLMGYHRQCETVAEAKARAARAADHLALEATRHGRVLLVGHGMMNRLISAALETDGWKTASNCKFNRYWDVSRFYK